MYQQQLGRRIRRRNGGINRKSARFRLALTVKFKLEAKTIERHCHYWIGIFVWDETQVVFDLGAYEAEK